MHLVVRTILTALILVVGLAVIRAPETRAEVAPLVDVAWLKDNYISSDVVVLDVRGQFAKVTEKEFQDGHIPGSVWAPYQGKWRTTRDGVVGVIPPVEEVSSYIGSLGVSNDKTAVIVPAGVSALEFGAATRVYWTLKHLGHDKVTILNGGYNAWTADKDNPVQQGPRRPTPATFTPNVRKDLIMSTEEAASKLKENTVYVDARPESQFTGMKKHPMAVRYGRIPGALNLDQSTLYDAQGNRLKSIEELKKLVPDSIKNSDKMIVSYCNTAHWAATNWFVLSEVLGQKNVILYDDSMVGWSRQASLPMATERSRWHDFKDWWDGLFK